MAPGNKNNSILNTATMKKGTERLRSEITKKFGTIAEFERSAGFKPKQVHTILNRIDRCKNKYYSFNSWNVTTLNECIMKTPKPKDKKYLNQKECIDVRKKIAMKYDSIQAFIEATGFGRTKLFNILNGKRNADDLLSVINK